MRYGLSFLDTGKTLGLKTMGKKVNYLMFDGKKYEAVEQEKYIPGSCDGCCFLTLEGGCTMPATDGFFISCNDGFIFAEEGGGRCATATY